eukprot:1086883-Rhodomonas_salina.4
MAAAGAGDDDDVVLLGESDSSWCPISLNDEVHKKYKQAYAKLKTECSQFVAKQGLTPLDLADDSKRKDIVAAMHSDLSILALIKEAGGALQKSQEKALLCQLLVQVKMEKTD